MPNQLDGLRVAILLERGVNEVEFHYNRLRMREAGAEVVVVGNHQLDYFGENHGRTQADLTIDQVDAAEFDGVVTAGWIAVVIAHSIDVTVVDLYIAALGQVEAVAAGLDGDIVDQHVLTARGQDGQ